MLRQPGISSKDICKVRSTGRKYEIGSIFGDPLLLVKEYSNGILGMFTNMGQCLFKAAFLKNYFNLIALFRGVFIEFRILENLPIAWVEFRIEDNSSLLQRISDFVHKGIVD